MLRMSKMKKLLQQLHKHAPTINNNNERKKQRKRTWLRLEEPSQEANTIFRIEVVFLKVLFTVRDLNKYM